MARDKLRLNKDSLSGWGFFDRSMLFQYPLILRMALWPISGQICCHMRNNLNAMLASTYTTSMLSQKPWERKVYKPNKNVPITGSIKNKSKYNEKQGERRE